MKSWFRYSAGTVGVWEHVGGAIERSSLARCRMS
jgi:hypothetical protein